VLGVGEVEFLDYPTARRSGPSRPLHQVSKLYFLAGSRRVAVRAAAFGRAATRADGGARPVRGWGDWVITTRLDTTAHCELVRRAVECHQTQVAVAAHCSSSPSLERQRALWGTQEFYRAFSLVDGVGDPKTDLVACLS
jgi:LmbE family N-acetylglucosaminyl deacetylase